ncbi:thermonuclease family protein [Cyanobium sp. Lug-B]|jgi:endonuclease YncB( thermonuclease family)|uniref:thermonuclease family protein n=1 Tax=Cyanobium sp. Lug-B TaxID=2823716 RepID=UPI0020CCD74A|nr:thermonuclease family protein [Cyanobium sp. Lug-B]MCP9796200.1 thermonuclease family protein [Cyanobium sp. Lug-B]
MGRKQQSHSRILGLCAAWLVLAGPAAAATVISVGDGDTLRVEDRGKKITIRLACIDAPETAQAPFGMASRRLLQELAPIGAKVQLVIKDRDRYGRTVADIQRNGQSINMRMVRAGQAFAYRQYLAKCDAAAYLKAEREAERASLGVWAVPGGINRPWDFRRGRRSGSTSTSKPQAPAPLGTMQPRATPSASRYRCKEIGSFARAQELLRHGHTYLDRDGDGVACEALR